MRIRVNCSIGHPQAKHRGILEIPDSELEGLTEAEKEEYLEKETWEWACEHLESWYEIIDENK